MLVVLAILGLSLGLALGLPSSSSSSHSVSTGTYNKPFATSPPWYPSPRGGTQAAWKESYRKAAAMVARMTLAEKVNATTGTGWRMGPCVGNTGSALGVGWRGLCLQDGPLGVRLTDSITVFPAGITVAGTWNKALMERRGRALGREMRGKGVNVMLGPCVVGGKFPAGGRGFEGFGADPYLQGVAVGRTVRGVQEEGVIACVKHFVGNEQETFRQAAEGRSQGWELKEAISSNIGERALREIYTWPFQDAVQAGVGSVMCSYNQVNNSYSCQNSYLLNGVLKGEFQFQGFVVSDWIAQRSGVASVLAGLDMSMPGDGYSFSDGKPLLGAELTRAVLNGSIPIERLDDMALRVVAAWYQMGQDSDYPEPNFSSWFRTPTGPKYVGSDEDGKKELELRNTYKDVREEHHELAREIAAEGIVLLKNVGGTLPFKTGKGAKKAIMVFGSDAAGNPKGMNSCDDRGCNTGTLGQGWGSGTAEYSFFDSPLDAITAKAAADRTMLEYILDDYDYGRINALAEKTPNATCIVFVSSASGEGYIMAEGHRGDRNNLKLWHDGDALILAVASRCRDTVVVIHSVGPVEMEKWIEHANVTAVVLAHLPGQEAGNSLADVLWGLTNPSGRLPYTIGKSLTDYGPGSQIMYTPNHVIPQEDFEEGLYTDYRHFDKYGITPRFPFGFGLSYTTFAFEDVKVDMAMVPTKFPPKRPDDAAAPPGLNSTLPDARELMFPEGVKRVKGYIYPYLSSSSVITGGSYPYPENYTTTPHTPSPVAASALYDTLLHVIARVRNTGAVPGEAVAQLYISFPTDTVGDVDFPVRALRGFEKVGVGVGESAEVSFDLTRRDLSYWDEGVGNWRLPVDREGRWGGYGITIAGNSRDPGGVRIVTEKVEVA